MRSPKQQALCGKVLPGLGENVGGTCLEPGQQGSGKVWHPNQGPCPGHLQVQTAWYIFDHTATFVCVMLVTWFSFVSFTTLKASSSELRHSGHSEDNSLLCAPCLLIASVSPPLLLCFHKSLLGISMCDVLCMTGASQHQLGQVTRCWWSWPQLVALGAASNTPELPAAPNLSQHRVSPPLPLNRLQKNSPKQGPLCYSRRHYAMESRGSPSSL